MHVDGFRFDLASVFSRNESGEPMVNPPIAWEIDSDPVLAGAKLIAEAWDAGGLYQVGSFGQDRWKEWNGKFRDDVRSLIKGDRNTVVKLRERISGSLDLYRTGHRPAGQSMKEVPRQSAIHRYVALRLCNRSSGGSGIAKSKSST
jgi:isoamylase